MMMRSIKKKLLTGKLNSYSINNNILVIKKLLRESSGSYFKSNSVKFVCKGINLPLVKIKFRCLLTGRPMGVSRKHKINRHFFREAVNSGILSGIKKTSF